ncbi:hypothetical protein YN1_3780 [Nanoarchaeota archaeon]
MDIKELRELEKMLENGNEYLDNAEKICAQLIYIIRLQKEVNTKNINEVKKAISIISSDKKLEVVPKISAGHIGEIIGGLGALIESVAKYERIFEALGLIKKKK